MVSSRVKEFASGAILASAMWQNRPVQIMGHSGALLERAGLAAQSRGRQRGAGAVGVWLLVCCALVFAMVVVGGVTRLTHSGLSITEWQPIVGTLPPLSAADWNDAFAKYQATPEYAQVNKGMSLDAFKSIFWWEYFHRVLGRAIGVVFFVPLCGSLRGMGFRRATHHDCSPYFCSVGCRARSGGTWCKAGWSTIRECRSCVSPHIWGSLF